MNPKLFIKMYQPHIRPDNIVEDLSLAFRLDEQYRSDFRMLRPFLPRQRSDWGDKIVMSLNERGAIGENITSETLDQLLQMYREHAIHFRAGRFDADYLTSVEAIALFLASNDIKTLWVASAYADLTKDLIDALYKRLNLNRRIPPKTLMRTLVTALSVEMNQIQRTFTMYERYVSDALVKDLTMGGFMTAGHDPIKPPTPIDPAAGAGLETVPKGV